MALDPSIILGGRQADIIGSMAQGNALAQAANKQRNDNALAGFLRDNGGSLMAGDSNALAQYAQYDPQAAFGMQRQLQQDAQRADELKYQRGRDTVQDARADRQFEMQQSRYAKQDERADQEWQWKVAEYAAKKTEAERLAEAAQIEDAVKMGLAAPDAASWDAMMAQQAPDLGGQFDSREALANRYMGVADILKGQQAPKPADEYQRYAQEEQMAGRQPLGRIEFEQAKKGNGFSVTTADGTTVTYGGGKASGGGKETEGGMASAGYLQRMTGAEKVIDELSKDGVSTIGLMKGMAVGTRGEGYALGPGEQRLLQAQRDWVRAKLRKESGAVIGDEEMAEEIRTYFAQPGESKEVIAQKRNSRKAAERQFQITSGASAERAGPLTDEAAPGQRFRFNPETGDFE